MERIKRMLREAVKLAAFRILYPAAYALGCFRPLDRELTLFCEVRHGFLTDSYIPLVKELEKRNKPYEVFYIHNNAGGLGYLWRYLVLCFKLPKAGNIFIDDTCNLFGAFRLRKGSRLIQTWHSCGAFKKWGYSIAGLSFGEDPEQLDKYPAHCNYSLVTVSSKECIRHFNEAFGFDRNGRKCVKATGVARTDYFFKKENLAAAYKKLYKLYPQTKGKKILLYAPTYRGDADDAKAPEMFDIAKMYDTLGQGAVLLIKQHGFVKEVTQIPPQCKDRVFDVSRSMKIEELLIVSDAVITDYSSLIFEYSLFLRPMVFYACDLEEFYDYRGFYYKYDNDFLPGDICRTQQQLFESTKKALKGADEQTKERLKNFRDRFMGACDGHSSERIIDYIFRRKQP